MVVSEIIQSGFAIHRGNKFNNNNMLEILIKLANSILSNNIVAEEILINIINVRNSYIFKSPLLVDIILNKISINQLSSIT